MTSPLHPRTQHTFESPDVEECTEQRHSRPADKDIWAGSQLHCSSEESLLLQRSRAYSMDSNDNNFVPDESA